MLKQYIENLKLEFHDYNASKLSKDILAGVTVAAVALPVALAFGVGCGADAAAGMITAILCGFVFSSLSGASYQISGPTGALMAVLLSVSQHYGIQGIFMAGFLSGFLLIAAGYLKFGRLIQLIPMPVIAGFTSGIAMIVAIGQIDHFFGVTSSGSSPLLKLLSYLQSGFHPQWQTTAIGLLVVAVMIFWPPKWNSRIPGSLVALILALAVNMFLHLPVATIGEMPKTILPANRLSLESFSFTNLNNLIMPAVTIAALCMVESLLCGASAGCVKKEKLKADQELVSQGIGNIILPFFGGIPATAALARTSVAVKSGGVTRLTGVAHGAILLIAMLALGGVMSHIPMAALAGILMVVAWRMNDWHNIRYIFGKHFKFSATSFLTTLMATLLFDLTWAIVIGILAACFLFIVRVSDIDINIANVDEKRLFEHHGIHLKNKKEIKVVYFSGPLFFPVIEKTEQELSVLAHNADVVIFSMRGVSLIDISCVQSFHALCQKLQEHQCDVMFSGVQPKVMRILEKSGTVELVGKNHFFWSTDEAIVAADQIPDKISAILE